MSEAKHTPGPWVAHHGWAEPYSNNAETLAAHPDWCEITGPEDGSHLSINGHFGLANARLIAAAPDLLAAMKLYVDHFGDPLKVAVSAIAKAEGRQ